MGEGREKRRGMNLNSGKNNGEDKLRKARKGQRRRETAFL
jgi:hypothetical protein